MNILQPVSEKCTALICQYVSPTVRSAIDVAWSWACLSTPFVALGVVGVWHYQESSVQAVAKNPPQYQVSEGDPLFVDSPVTLTQDVNKAEYKAWITNSKGEVVYRYPSVFLEKNTGLPRNLALNFPAQEMPPGVYYMNAQLTYALNPIKTATMLLNFGRITVKDKS